MDHVARIIEVYEKQGINGLMNSPSMPDDIREISAGINTLDDTTRKKIEAILKEFLQDTENRIDTLQSEIKEEKQSLKHSQDSAEACIAYLNSARTGEQE